MADPNIYTQAGAQWNVDPLLLRAIEQTESGGQTAATSPAGAQGNMQFMPATANAEGVADARQPAFSVPGAAKLIGSLMDGPAKGDVTTALRMYQGGEDQSKWGPQNAAYAGKVAQAYAQLRGAGQPPVVQAQFNPATMSDADLDKALRGSEPAPAGAQEQPDIAKMPDADLDRLLSGKPPASEFKTVPVHPAPDNSGAMTNLSDEDYAKLQGAPRAPAAPAQGPVAPIEVASPPQKSLGGLEAGWAPGKAPPDPSQPAPGAGLSYIANTVVPNALQTAAGVVDAAGHGLSFGADRLLDAVTPNPLAPQQQQMRQQFQQQHPILNATAEAAGALPTYVTGEGALASVLPEVAGGGLATKTGNVLSSAARNAITSAALSGGTQEGDLAQRGIAAGKGAIAGAVAPPAFSAIGSVLQKATAPIMARLSGDLATNQAVGQIGKALTRDQMTPADLVANLQRLGPGAALVDAGGANVRNLGETVANMPGEPAQAAETFLEGRAAGQQGRLNAAVTAATGSTGDFHAALGDLAQKRATEAAPRYEAAFNRIKVTPDEAANVQRFVTDRIGQEALQKGLRVVELEKLAAGEPFNPADYGVTRNDDGKFELASGVPNLRLYDAVKRGYDEIVEGFRDPTSGRLNLNQYGRAVNDVRATYVKDLRDMFPRYAGALDAWAGPSRAMDALSMGRRALANDPEVNAKTVAGLSDTDKQFFLSGVARALKDKIESAQDGADATRRIFGNQLVRDKIKAALGNDEAFDQFQKTMEQEAAFARTRNDVLKGSQTARRLAGQQDLGFDAATPVAHAVSGNPLGAVLNVAKQGMNALTAPSSATTAPLGKMLFTPGGPNQDLLDALARNRNPLIAPLARRAVAVGANRLQATP